MSGRTRAGVAAPLIVAGLLAVAGCGGGSAPGGASAGSTAAASGDSGGTAGTGSGTSGSTTGSGSSANASCTGGATATEAGVILIQCDGTAKIHVQAGSRSKDFTGGTCHHSGDIWTATVGVITEYGTYKGPPLDSLSVNNQASGKGTIQLSLGGKTMLVDDASFHMSGGGSSAHLQGKTVPLSDLPGTLVTVDVSC